MLDFTENGKNNDVPDWGEEKSNVMLDVSMTRGSANALLGILAKLERGEGFSLSDRDWYMVYRMSGELIGAIWRAEN